MFWRHFKQMKENDGRAARNATIRMALWFVAAQVAFFLIFLLVRVEEGPPHVQHMRISSARLDGGMPNQERAVLEARYFLMDLKLPGSAVSSMNDHESYHGVTGVFCPLDWHLQKANPSSVPMFRDLVSHSSHCQQHKVELDLHEVARTARHYDEHSKVAAPRQLKLSGVVFHETRCGSTLVANLLSAADPVAHRVYSEASPLLMALQACDTARDDCDEEKADALLSDVLYLMGRSSDPREKRVFYKIQSVGVRSMTALTRLMEDVPWIFVYRDSVEVMMSHFKDADIRSKAVCLRGRNRPHALVREIAKEHNRETTSLSSAEYCAVHLASLCEAAIREQSTRGRFVNYANLPDALWDTVLPDHFDIQLNALHISGMKKAAGVYSKGRGEKADQEWEEDAAQKQAKVSDEIRDAAKEFLEPSFAKMEELSAEYR